MKVPKDQGLFLTVFLSISFGVILTTWIALPVYHKEAEEEDTAGNPAVSAALEKLLTPEELVKKTEKVLLQAESALTQLSFSEKEKTDRTPSKSKGPS
jgi:hypothetical protein